MNRKFGCLCEKNLADCDTCTHEAYKQWLAYTKHHQQGTLGQLMQRAIQESKAYVVLGIIQNTDLDINTPCEPDKYASVSPLLAALHANNPQLVSLILEHPRLDLAQSLPKYDTWTWAKTCSLEVLRIFLNYKKNDINKQDGNGKTLLHEIVQDKISLEKLTFLLKQHGLMVDIKQNDNTTPLYQAALWGNVNGVDLLLQYSVDVNNRNSSNQWTILMCSVAENHATIVEKLLQNPNIDVNAQDAYQNTALHIASERGYWRVVEFLLGHRDIKINEKNAMGWTPLSRATFGGHERIVKLLLDRADLEINFVDNDRQTALYWAVSTGNLDIVRRLLEHPEINVNITNRPASQTVYEIAVSLNYHEIADILIKKVASTHPADELSINDNYIQKIASHPQPEFIMPFIPDPPLE